MGSREEREGVRQAVRGLLGKDRAAGGLKPLPEYQKLFPGFWDVVAEEHGALTSLDAPPPSPAPGVTERPRDGEERIGPYRVIREVGRGGMGVVYEAQDTRLPRRVALKVLSPQFAASGHLRLRFEREAAIASKLDHPHICTVYEAGEADRVPYMAMRFLEGSTLAELIAAARERGRTSGVVPLPREEAPAGADAARPARTRTSESRLELDRVLALFETAARALHVAHEKGLIHRDIKPHNVMVTAGGEPVLLDFGLAREEDGEGHGLTQTGSLMGTPAYMSPEQLTAQRIKLDRRTDVYSLGVSLYEAVTLRVPFEAPTVDKLYQKILVTTAEDPRRLNPALPRDLKVVLETALEKDRDRRYQTALDLAEDIVRVRRSEPIRARPAGALLRLGRWAQRNPALASSVSGLFLALAGGLGASLHLLRQADRALGEATQAKGRAEASEKEAKASAKAAEEARGEAVEDRGRAQAALEKEKKAQEDRVKALADLDAALKKAEADRDAKAKALAEAEGLRLPLVSAAVLESDPTLALLLALEAMERHPTLQGRNAVLQALRRQREVATMIHPCEVTAFSATRDGSLAATVGQDGIVRVWDTARAVVVREVRDEAGQHWSAHLSPDGSRLLVGAPGGRVRLLDPRSGRVVAEPERAWSRGLGFSGDGRWIHAMEWSASRDRLLPAPVLLDARDGRRVASFEGGTEAPVAVAMSPDGSTIACTSLGGWIHAWDRESGRAVAAIRTGGGAPPMLSVAFGGRRALSWGQGFWLLVDLEAGRVVREGKGGAIRPVAAEFRPDGGALAVCGADQSLRILDAGTGADLLEVGPPRVRAASVAWTPDGTRLLVASEDAVLVLDAAKGERVDVLRGIPGWVGGVEVSGDGGTLLASGADGSLRSVLLRDPPDFPFVGPVPGGALRGEDAANPPQFLPGDGEVLLLRGGRVAFHSSSTGAETGALPPAGGGVLRAVLSPGGDRILTQSEDSLARMWDARTKEMLWASRDAPASTTAASFLEGGWLCFEDSEGGVRVLEAASGDCLARIRRADAPIRMLSFSADRSRLLAVTADGVTTVWDPQGGRRIAALPPFGSAVAGARFEDDGRTVTRTGPDGKRDAVWDMETGDVDLDPDGTGRGPAAGPVAPPEKGTIEFVDPGTGSRVARIRGDPEAVAFRGIAPDGRLVAFAGKDGVPRVFVAATGEEHLALGGAGSPALSLAFSRDGTRAVTLHGDGSVRFWPLDPERIGAARKPRDLSPAERKSHSIGTPEEQVARRAAWRERWLDGWNVDDPVVLAARQAVGRAIEKEVLLEDAREALAKDGALPGEVRRTAVRLADRDREDVDRLHRIAWKILPAAGRPQEDYARALRAVETLRGLRGRDPATDGMLALAMLRVGRSREALEVLGAPPEPPGGSGDPLTTFVCGLVRALALHREGRGAEARTALGTAGGAWEFLRGGDESNPWATGFPEEVLEAVLGARGSEVRQALEETLRTTPLPAEGASLLRAREDLDPAVKGAAVALMELVPLNPERLRDFVMAVLSSESGGGLPSTPEDLRRALACVDAVAGALLGEEAFQGVPPDVLRAGIHYMLGEYEPALRALERVPSADIGGEEDTVLHFRALCFAGLRRFEEAEAAYTALEALSGTRGAAQGRALLAASRAGAPRGVFVVDVEAGGRAEGGGLRAGDVVLRVGKEAVERVIQFQAAWRAFSEGERGVLAIWRAGSELEVRPEGGLLGVSLVSFPPRLEEMR